MRYPFGFLHRKKLLAFCTRVRQFPHEKIIFSYFSNGPPMKTDFSHLSHQDTVFLRSVFGIKPQSRTPPGLKPSAVGGPTIGGAQGACTSPLLWAVMLNVRRRDGTEFRRTFSVFGDDSTQALEKAKRHALVVPGRVVLSVHACLLVSD